MKRCRTCGETKPLTEFRKHIRREDGHMHYCKSCCAKRQKNQRKIRDDNQPGCVYTIINLINNKIYVGETTRGKQRWIEHITYLRGNGHHSSSLQADFNQFGEEAFEWRIIEKLPKDREIREEKNTIQKLLAEGKELYNIVLD